MDTKDTPVTEPTTPSAEAPVTENKAMDVVAAPTTPDLGEDGEETKTPEQDVSQPVNPQDTRPKTPRDKGVMVAITVAILVVVALSAIAVFAYMSGSN